MLNSLYIIINIVSMLIRAVAAGMHSIKQLLYCSERICLVTYILSIKNIIDIKNINIMAAGTSIFKKLISIKFCKFDRT